MKQAFLAVLLFHEAGVFDGFTWKLFLFLHDAGVFDGFIWVFYLLLREAGVSDGFICDLRVQQAFWTGVSTVSSVFCLREADIFHRFIFHAYHHFPALPACLYACFIVAVACLRVCIYALVLACVLTFAFFSLRLRSLLVLFCAVRFQVHFVTFQSNIGQGTSLEWQITNINDVIKPTFAYYFSRFGH